MNATPMVVINIDDEVTITTETGTVIIDLPTVCLHLCGDNDDLEAFARQLHAAVVVEP